MKHKIIISCIFTLIVVSFILSCRKDHDAGAPPTLHFKIDSGYVSSDTTALIGKTFRIGLVAVRGDPNITNFIIKITTGSTQTYLDSGLNSPGFNIDKYLTKGVSPEETWTFIVRDKEGGSASISLKISADSNSVYGAVVTIPSIIFGAQNNSSVGSFYNLKNENIYDLPNAFLIQDSIDLCYYYDFLQAEDNVISSPAATIDSTVYPGPYTLANWTIRNETRFMKTTLTEADFNSVANDSLLIATYYFPSSKKKAKNLATGDIYSFKTSAGKLGLFRVLDVNGTDAGTVEIAIKVQS